MERADSQIEPEAPQVKETKNLCYSATYWKTKERPLISNLSLLQMYRQRNNSSSTMKNHSDSVPQKANDDFPETKLKDTEYCDLIENSI